MAVKMVLQRALEDEYMQQIHDLGVETIIAQSEADVLGVIGDADAYFGRMTPEILEAAKKLRWVQATSAGLDGYYFDELRESDLAVTNIRGIYSDVIADHVFSMVMAFARGLHYYVRNQSRGKWEKGAPVIHLAGTTLGVVGLGGIGLAVAERGPTFGMRVLGMDPAPKGKPDFIERIYSPDELSAIVGESDFVVICVPHTAETEGLFDADMFGAMKNTGILINIGRGKVVQLQALTEALQSGQIGGAGLDVYEEEPLSEGHALWAMENVILTPHVAGISPEIDKRRKALIVENVRRFCAGESLLNVVDNKKGYVVDATSIWK
jgi:phosphoglycerate dehydrogenase-like enzyme